MKHKFTASEDGVVKCVTCGMEAREPEEIMKMIHKHADDNTIPDDCSLVFVAHTPDGSVTNIVSGSVAPLYEALGHAILTAAMFSYDHFMPESEKLKDPVAAEGFRITLSTLGILSGVGKALGLLSEEFSKRMIAALEVREVIVKNGGKGCLH